MMNLTDELEEKIKTCESTQWLARLAAHDQYEYWYDPCGKSGWDFSPRMSKLTQLCLRRIAVIEGLEK